MSQFGHVSAVNLSRQSNVVHLWSSSASARGGCHFASKEMNALSFGCSDSMGHKLKSPVANTVILRSRRGASPLKVCFFRTTTG